MAAPQVERPPIIPWLVWYQAQLASMFQGLHILFNGPTQSGKTVLCRLVSRGHAYVVVFGTKPVDPSLDDYIKEGYLRIDHWPPTRDEIRKSAANNNGAVRVILWPKIKSRADLRRFRAVYQRALEEIFIEGRWCFVVDEGLWLASPKGLDLGQELADTAYACASNKVSMHLLIQRPAFVPPIAWGSCMQSLVFHGGNTRDVRELASLSTYPPRDAELAIRQLRGRQFLDLPCRGNAAWSISEVDLRDQAAFDAAHGYQLARR